MNLKPNTLNYQPRWGDFNSVLRYVGPTDQYRKLVKDAAYMLVGSNVKQTKSFTVVYPSYKVKLVNNADLDVLTLDDALLATYVPQPGDLVHVYGTDNPAIVVKRGAGPAYVVKQGKARKMYDKDKLFPVIGAAPDGEHARPRLILCEGDGSRWENL